MAPALVEPPLDFPGDRRLPGAGETREPESERPLAEEPLALAGGDPSLFTPDVLRARRAAPIGSRIWLSGSRSMTIPAATVWCVCGWARMKLPVKWFFL